MDAITLITILSEFIHALPLAEQATIWLAIATKDAGERHDCLQSLGDDTLDALELAIGSLRDVDVPPCPATFKLN